MLRCLVSTAATILGSMEKDLANGPPYIRIIKRKYDIYRKVLKDKNKYSSPLCQWNGLFSIDLLLDNAVTFYILLAPALIYAQADIIYFLV